MFGLGTGELIVVFVLALIFIGPEKLPDLATKIGKLLRQVRGSMDDLKDGFKDDLKK
jgi:Tat protein translocase TatB subunit